VASITAQNAGQEGEIERPTPEGVSILAAMDGRGTDQTESLRGMPATDRARAAAAHGFATGTAGDKRSGA